MFSGPFSINANLEHGILNTRSSHADISMEMDAECLENQDTLQSIDDMAKRAICSMSPVSTWLRLSIHAC